MLRERRLALFRAAFRALLLRAHDPPPRVRLPLHRCEQRVGRDLPALTVGRLRRSVGGALAQQLGAGVMDMEYIQTHPTVEQTTSTLVAEAIRRCGAYSSCDR